MFEFPKLALKSLEFVLMSICMRNYGINHVSKRINFIASVNVATRTYRIMRPLSAIGRANLLRIR